MLRIDRAAEGSTPAPPTRCRAVLTDVAGYPSWASLIEQVEPAGEQLLVTARVMGLGLQLACVVEEAGDAVTLRRVPFDDEDDERFCAEWTTIARADGGTDVRLRVTAALDAPGPAALLRGRVERLLADDLLADLLAAV